MEFPGRASEPGTIDDDTYNRIKDLIHNKCGITLGPAKKALVAARVRKRMRELQITGHDEYFKAVIEDKTGVELVRLLDSIATNVTSFYRESGHFDVVKQALSKWEDAGQTRFRLWSAACSSGEEAYTMAFTVKEALSARADVKILATDISTKVLGTAHQGIYEMEKTHSIPKDIKNKYMNKILSGDKEFMAVKSEIRNMVVYKRLNLTEMPFPMNGPLDVILCRNVMIYFDKDLRRRLAVEFHRLLKPGGLLIIGLTESLIEISNDFKRIGSSVYIK
ncbi:MAG: methyltransferase domain-containing protein [Candidatus Goldbacteria bacterium]|nr:methyltransferase domain-containing protein [Candidatus Goldiibacteriota bacterium]